MIVEYPVFLQYYETQNNEQRGFLTPSPRHLAKPKKSHYFTFMVLVWGEVIIAYINFSRTHS